MEGSLPRSPWQREAVHELPIDRRRFLLLAGSVTAALAFAPGELLAGKPRTAPIPLQPWRLSESGLADALQTARSLLSAAVLAPSVCNSQPWRFEVEGPSIRLLADASRALPSRDPDRRELLVSLGCALENLLVAARRHGLRPVVSYFPNEGERGVVAEVRLETGEPGRDAGLFDAIPRRRTNRRNYEQRPLTGAQRAMLDAQVGDDSFRLLWLEGEKRLKALGQLANEAVHDQFADRRCAGELYRWLRFSDAQQRSTGDGLSLDALRIGGPTRWMGRRSFRPGSWALRYGADAIADQARSGIRSCAALCLLVSRTRGDQQRLTGGQVFERIALKATQMGLACQPLNAMVARERYRSDLRQAFGFAEEDPLVMLRLGRAKGVRATPRRAVALVTSFTAS